MTLFTAEGLIRASAGGHNMSGTAAVVHNAYLRWLTTQGERARPAGEPGWLVTQPVLHARRAPGNSCLSGLGAGVGTRRTPANPDSKGCGAVMRSAPFGWLPRDDDEIWNLAIDCAVFTHGHPSGYYSAAAFAVIIRHIFLGNSLSDSIEHSVRRLERVGNAAREVLAALANARELAARGDSMRVAELGGGWVGEEALAIAVYCALATDVAEEALLAAVNHSGDSDSTGAMCGNIVGALLGEDGLPNDWAAEIEGHDVLLELADDFAYEFTRASREPVAAWAARYPGH